MFTPSFFQSNRQRLLAELPAGSLVVLAAHDVMQSKGDDGFPFVQEPNFWYLSGIESAGAVIVCSQQTSYIIAPRRSAVEIIFDGAVEAADLQKVSGVDAVYTATEGWHQLKPAVTQASYVYTLLPQKANTLATHIHQNPGPIRLAKQLKRWGNQELQDARPALESLRVRKQAPELRALQQAIDITAEGLAQCAQEAKTRTHEHELLALLSSQYQMQGAEHGYQPVVASGTHATVVHYRENRAPLPEQGMVLIDSGAAVQGYSADISRTYSCGAVTERQAAVYEAVVTAHQAILAELKLGMTLIDLERVACRVIAEQLQLLGLLKDPEDTKTLRRYYPHAISHFLGLEVHDVGDYHMPLEADMVFTVEPGIYIPEEAIGVRVEDNIVMTKKGFENLSAHIPIAKRTELG